MSKKLSSLSALGGLVYSTDTGRQCPECRQPVAACVCGQPQLPAGDGVARVRRETKGRGGKTVTTVSGVPLVGEALKALAAALKKRCCSEGWPTERLETGAAMLRVQVTGRTRPTCTGCRFDCDCEGQRNLACW